MPDTLHPFLRISDQLIAQFLQILRHKDHVKTSRNVDIKKCDKIKKFQDFVDKLSISWQSYTYNSTGQMQYRDFTGPEHLKIQDKIDLDDLFPWHPKLENIEWLWREFTSIMSLMKILLKTVTILGFPFKLKLQFGEQNY